MKFQINPEKIGAYDIEWCYDCERHRDDCVCEELCDHFRSVCSGETSGEDVRVFPASPEPPPIVPRAQWEIDALTELDNYRNRQ